MLYGKFLVDKDKINRQIGILQARKTKDFYSGKLTEKEFQLSISLTNDFKKMIKK